MSIQSIALTSLIVLKMLVPTSLQAVDLSPLCTLPKEDRKILELFFRQIVVSEIGYTLFGDKPMALLTYVPTLQLQLSSTKDSLRSLAILQKGGKVWQKYQHLFPRKRFDFVIYKRAEAVEIALIDKRGVEQLRKKHAKLFSTLQSKSVVEILQLSLKEKTEHYHSCLGTLLGYGVENSKTFEEEINFQSKRESAPLLPQRKKSNRLRIESAEVSLNANSLKRSTPPFCKNLVPYCSKNSALSPISPLRFKIIAHSLEHISLQKSAEQTYKKLIEIYYSENFLEKILLQLTQ